MPDSYYTSNTILPWHVFWKVLYYDGDVEVLRLEKERWELIDSNHKPTNKVSDFPLVFFLSLKQFYFFCFY